MLKKAPSPPAATVVGTPQSGDGDEIPIAPVAAGAATSPAGEMPEDKRALGMGGSLPPLSGGTTFGAEFADVPRTRWKSRRQYVLVLMGYCIGIGNLWRFPYLCGKYGGGAFVIAYLFMLFLVAAPLFFYESVLGQKFQKGPAETFRKMAPRWVGVAYVPVAMTLFYLPYYQMIVAYSLHYFLASFQSPLPWATEPNVIPGTYLSGPPMANNLFAKCGEWYGTWHGTLEEAKHLCDRTPGCSVLHDYACDADKWRVCTENLAEMIAHTAVNGTSNACTMIRAAVAQPVNPEYYLDNMVLNRAESIGAEGGSEIHGQLLLEVIVVWIVTAACLIKGIHSAGKAAYVTVILPVVMIVILFFRCVTLEGASAGLAYYLTPRFEHLLRIDVWGLAAGQIIFSLSPGTGTCISLASFHDREYKGLFKDCVLVAACNSAFSLFGGLVVFSVVGNLAFTQGMKVEHVAASGEGLAFIVFAQGLAQMGEGVASFFSVLFFLTLFLLGLDSSFAVVETLQTYLNDWMLARNPGTKISVQGNALRLILLSIALLLMGLPYATRAGYPLLEIADHWVPTYCLTVTVLLEYIMLGFVYTPEQVLEDVEASTGVVLPQFFLYQIKYIAPAVLASVVALLLISEMSSNAMSGYPAWAVLFFGIFPTLIALSTALWPAVRFRLRRLLQGSTLAPKALEEARQRARGPGFQTFHEEEMIESAGASLSKNRA